MPDWEAFYRRFREPDFVPGYEILNRLGGGAFGEVFKARKTSIGKAYAIKFLKLDEASQRDAVERELEHVRHFAAIDHPHLVTIEDMGMVQDIPYLIMGYAGEETLARRLARGDLGQEEALRYVVQACRGVLALHDRRLAHFDLKPSNVFLKGDVARVGDYGLAKLLAEGQKTLSFGRGTPHYMAPEMLRNRADQRADIYSLGVILYEALVGKVPFEPDSGLGILVRDSDDPPPFPDDFPPALRPVVERCLRLDPDDRYADVGALLADLGQTGRQGDSVTIPWSGSGRTTAPGAGRPVTARPGEKTPVSTGELKVAAAELARGAVEVARGVWGGVRSARGSTAPVPGPAVPGPVVPEARANGRPPSADEEEVLDVQTLADVPAPPAERRGVLGILDRVRRESKGGGHPEPEPELDLETAPLERAIDREWRDRGPDSLSRAPQRTAGETIPVPPRVEGGLVGSAWAALVLGLEILVSVASGPVLAIGRGVAGLGDRVVRRVPGFLGAVLRTAFFVLFFFVVGAVLTVVILLATSSL